ncbi:SUMF1/EgtB/PvdO family nonheme iron enzyme [Sorangium sp. So ce887]|uniref:SUMF1/EgtB/PvdO family nonheme iron enzyme n=1 Tax=Sorangium sp. So ce887 TaxID=3133324 RepID=UPI003F627E02
MVSIPAGRFLMGSEAGEPNAFDDQHPRREVVIAAFEMASGGFEMAPGAFDDQHPRREVVIAAVEMARVPPGHGGQRPGVVLGSLRSVPEDDDSRGRSDGCGEGEFRVLRGGSWFSMSPAWGRAADRERHEPSWRGSRVGFRCARGPVE